MKLSRITLTILTIFIICLPVAAQEAGSNGSMDPSKENAKRGKSFRPTRSQIVAAQEKLRGAGLFTGEPDGRYSEDFRNALKQYQESNGFEKTGKLDEATIARLEIPLTDKQKGIEGPKRQKRAVFRVNKDQVSEAQQKLKDLGIYSGEISGKYDKAFRTAVREYQSANGLKRKGSLNRATLEKMGIDLTDQQSAIPVNPNDLAGKNDGKRKRGPVFRATKTQISAVQSMLRSKGLYSGEETGKLDPETRAAIKQWQGSNGVKVTGTLNKTTLEAMGIELTERQKES